jgi:hypothetical protein
MINVSTDQMICLLNRIGMPLRGRMISKRQAVLTRHSNTTWQALSNIVRGGYEHMSILSCIVRGRDTKKRLVYER